MPDWLFQLLTAGAGAASVYAAIRADLARLHEKTENAKDSAKEAKDSAKEAHERIDSILQARR